MYSLSSLMIFMPFCVALECGIVVEEIRLISDSAESQTTRRRATRSLKKTKNKTIGLISKQLCTCITLFFVHFFAVFAHDNVKCLISRFVKNVNKPRRNLILSLPELGYGLMEFNSRRVHLHLTK